MGDSLSIPDDKRAGSGRGSWFHWPSRHSWSFWIVVVVLVMLNGWFDYYHPRGILFDIIIVIILAVKSDRRSLNQ
jgi:hypothetical protein